MVVVYIDVSAENGFVFVVYDEDKKQPIYGETSRSWNAFKKRIESGNSVRYKVYLDSMVRIDELLDDDDVAKGVIDKSGIYINPFDEDEGGEDYNDGEDNS
ncbi:MAG TPA: hypothetical protein GXX70_09560 [Tepidimicrobium sp.]|nr:hypothetical protein [Tepidimicrobium sp.]